jgi:hypothetical protein
VSSSQPPDKPKSESAQAVSRPSGEKFGLKGEIARAAAAGLKQQRKTQKAWEDAAAARFKAIKKRVLDQLGKAFGAAPGAHLILPAIVRYRRPKDGGGGEQKGWCVGLNLEPHGITIRERGDRGQTLRV